MTTWPVLGMWKWTHKLSVNARGPGHDHRRRNPTQKTMFPHQQTPRRRPRKRRRRGGRGGGTIMNQLSRGAVVSFGGVLWGGSAVVALVRNRKKRLSKRIQNRASSTPTAGAGESTTLRLQAPLCGDELGSLGAVGHGLHRHRMPLVVGAVVVVVVRAFHHPWI